MSSSQKVTDTSNLVTIQATLLIMGVAQSPCYLSLAFRHLAEHLPDKILQWFLQFLRYLDGLQIGITAKELTEFQAKADLEDPELDSKCQDPDCYVGDLSPPEEEMLGEAVPSDEQRCTRHLFRKKTVWKKYFPLFDLMGGHLGGIPHQSKPSNQRCYYKPATTFST